MRLKTIIVIFLFINIALVANTTGCPSNWTNTDGICYKVFEGLNSDWDSAQVVCVALGGYLAEIPNYFVQKTIAAGVTDNCWIGLRRNGTGEYNWRSGRGIYEFQYWKDGEQGSKECVSFHGTQSEWETNDCTDTFKCFICMAGSVYPPPHPKPQIGCYDGAIIEGRCYRAIGNSVTWQVAQWECELLGSDLAEISNENLNSKLISYLDGKPGPHYWIGLRRNDATGLYEWRSGRVLNDSFDPWKNGEDPASNTDNTKKCAEIHDGEWMLDKCDKKDVPYLCQSGQLPFPTACNNTVLTNGLETGGICYSISDSSATWYDANATCAGNGGRLASILNGEMSDEIQRIISSKGGTEDYWIGLKRDENTGQFQWTDGTNLTFNGWSDGIPVGGYGCVGVNGNSTNWLSLDCNRANHFICETDVCTGWTVRNGICYRKFEQTNMNWLEAVDLCEEENGYIAEIPNIYVNKIITDLLAEGDRCWIGLRNFRNIDYSWRIGNFSLGDVETTSGNGGGGVIWNENQNTIEKRWRIRSRSANYHCTVCMKGPLTEEAPTEICTELTTDITIDRGYCYRRIEDTPTNLVAASLTCTSYNGALYTFNDTRVNVRLYSSFKSSGRSFWLQDPLQYNLFVPHGDYFNLHKDRVEYDNGNNAECKILTEDGNTVGEMGVGSGSGSGCEDNSVNGDDNCQDCYVNYICRIDYVPDEYILQNLSTNDRCYWSVSGNRNWTEAETQCVTEGGHLVEIFNGDTQDITVSLIATELYYLDELYWIGIGEYVNLSSQWRSGANICYNNFSSNLNCQSYHNMSCVTIDKYGSWIAQECNNKLSFICGKTVTNGSFSPCSSSPTLYQTIATSCASIDKSSYSTVCNNTVLPNGLDTRGICYSISDSRATWYDASATCAGNGGRLARILNGEMSNEIQRIINSKEGTEDYWIGLKRDENTGLFQWTDGTNLTFNGWSDGIPMQGYGCVGVNGNSTNWLSLNCNSSNHFICEIDVCSGWRVRNGICYKKFETETNWEGAVELCKAENAYLAEIPSIYVNNVMKFVIKTDECWIGLSTDCTNYSWRIGNFSLSDTNRDVVLNINDTYKCGTIGVNGNDRWSLKDCNTPQTCTVCMKGPLTIEYPINVCDGVRDGIILVDRGSCYRSNGRRADELDLAILRCNRYNGDLYLFDDEEFNNRLIGIYNSFYNSPVYPKEFLNQYYQFTSQDGYFNLLTSNENITSPVMCQHVSNGELMETDCIDNINFICKIEYEPAEMTIKNDSTQGMYYWSVSGNRNWTEAETQCVTEGGHLVEIFNGDIQNITVSLIATELYYLDELYWIGIGEYVNLSSQWRSGANICYNNFSSNLMNESNHILSCVAIDKYGSWIAQECSNKRSFICGKDQSSKSTVCSNTVLSNGSDTRGICYSINDSRATWYDANATCAGNGGRLARILNRQSVREIQRMTNNGEDYWIGLKRDENTGQFQWTDGTNLTFNRWSDGIPMQGYGCVGVNGNTNNWVSLDCSSSNHFICETDVCSGWRIRNGICYKKFETETNWEGAVELCKAENAYLAEIPSIYVNNVLNAVVKTDECWIGLSTDCTDYSWRIENFSLSDTNRDVVLNINDTNKCGTIGVNGGERWSLKDCNTPLTCSVCMKGPLTIEYPIDVCDEVRNKRILVDRGSCYRMNAGRADELDLAILRCNRFNGDLYLFDNEEFNNRLIGIYSSFYNNSVYPKEFVNEYNLFTPQDGYFNVLTSNENITSPVMCQHVSNGELTETECINNINFICKIEYEPRQMTLNIDSTQDMHYWSVSGNRNWTEAETQCVTKGGHLLEIFNGDTQNIAVSLIATKIYYLDELYWIGIGEYVDSSSQWRSGANINYSNFSDQINTTQLSCVAIDKYGSWIVSDCGNRYSFICGKNTTESNTGVNEISFSGRINNAVNKSEYNKDIQDIERNLAVLINISIPAGERFEFMIPELNADGVGFGYNRSQTATEKIGEIELTIDNNSFPANTTVYAIAYNNSFVGDFSAEQMLILKVASDVITILASNTLNGTIRIKFIVNSSDNEGETFSCRSLNSDKTWNSSGIDTNVIGNIVECISNHLTTFAVLVTVSSNSAMENTEIQAYISVVLCGLSLFALLVTVLLYLCIGKKFYREDINIIQLNYVLSLIFALIAFLLLTIAYFAKINIEGIICTALTFVNHYTWLSVFSWNFCQALHIVFALFSSKLPFERHYLLMMAIGWGLPIPIVIVTFGIGIAQNTYLTTEANLCFLNTANGFIWALLAPIYLIILINICILFMVIGISMYVQRNRKDKKSYICRLMIGIGTTIPLLGIPWILGLLPNIPGITNNSELSWLSYIFVIFNASQGIIFFVVHVIRNTDVRALCSSNLKAAIDIEPDDKNEKKQREEMEGKLRGTEGKYTSRREVAPMYFTESTEDNVIFQNEHNYS